VGASAVGGLSLSAAGYTARMLWTVFIILGIIAFALIILGRRSV
jgi:hypothetical protein